MSLDDVSDPPGERREQPRAVTREVAASFDAGDAADRLKANSVPLTRVRLNTAQVEHVVEISALRPPLRFKCQSKACGKAIKASAPAAVVVEGIYAAACPACASVVLCSGGAIVGVLSTEVE